MNHRHDINKDLTHKNEHIGYESFTVDKSNAC